MKVTIAGKSTDMLASYWLAINTGSKTGLKTLDNLHISIASLIYNIIGEKIDYFITGDVGILQKSKELKDFTDLSVVTPEIVIKVEGLL